MYVLLLIFISLLLGYGQGVRHKRKKTQKEMRELKEKINILETAVKDEQRKNHLSMYDVNQKIKGDQSMLEENLVRYFSMSERIIGNKEITAFFDYLITKWGNEFISIDSQISIADINDVYQKFMKIDRTMVNPLTIKVKCAHSSVRKSCAIRDIFPFVIHFLQEIDIENYDICYNEFINAMNNVDNILL